MSDADVEVVMASVRETIKTTLGYVAKIKGFDVKAIISLIADVVMAVERVAPTFGKLTGDEKKKVAVSIINEFIDIPFLPEWMEAKVIGFAIDAIVGSVNKWFGHLWGAKVG